MMFLVRPVSWSRSFLTLLLVTGTFGVACSGSDEANSSSQSGGSSGSSAASGSGSGGKAAAAGGTNASGDGGAAGAPGSSDGGDGGSTSGSGSGGAQGNPGGAGGGGAQNASGGSAGQGDGGDGDGESGGEGGGASELDCTDSDGDGFGVGADCSEVDCDDADPWVSPGRAELADDGRDNDCSDGDLLASDGVGYYVDANDPACSDSAEGHGTQELPYCTLLMAVIEAYQNTLGSDEVGRSIFVAQGTYSEPLGIPKSMRLYGGYDSTDWSYDPEANETVLGGADDMSIYSAWLSINVESNVVVQGFSIKGGYRPAEPIFGVQVQSSGQVVLAHNRIVAGKGYQTMGVNIHPTANDVWLVENRISAGIPETASNYGVNNRGTATLWGNVIDPAQGHAGSWAAAVQNYGTMTLVNNVLNGGDYGGDAQSSYGLINSTTGDPPSPGTAWAVGNVIYGGRGYEYSMGVNSNSPLTLINNVIGDRTPGPLPWDERPSEGAFALALGFANGTVLEHNVLVALIYSDEESPPNPDARRTLLAHSDTDTTLVNDLAVINDCDFTGCVSAENNLTVDPGFVGLPDFHLGPASPLLGAGKDPLGVIAGGIARVDIDGEARPLGAAWEIGIDEQDETP